MNVWILSAYDQPNGMSSRSYDLALGLTDLGYKVTILTNSYCHWTHKDLLSKEEKYKLEKIQQVNVLWLKTFNYKGSGMGRGLNMLTNFFQIIKRHKLLFESPDVVVGPSVPLLTGLAGYILALKFNSKFIFEVRDVWPIALVDSGSMSKRSLIYLIFRFIEKLLYRKSHHISSTLPFIHEHVESSGADPNKISWIPNCMNGAKGKSKTKNSNFQVAYLGGFGHEHDVINIVKAAHILQDSEIEGLEFNIYGNGPGKAACLEEAKKKELTNINFYESVAKSEVQSKLVNADVLVACLIDSPVYRFGINLNKLYDYFLAAKPIVFSGNVINNMVQEANAGISIPPEDPQSLAEAVLKVKNMTEEKRLNLGENGFRYATIHFSKSVMASKFEKLIIN